MEHCGTKMDKAGCKNGPQAGLREEESRPSTAVDGSPLYSGVGNNRLVGRHTTGLREHDLGITTTNPDSDNACDKDIVDLEAEACGPKAHANATDSDVEKNPSLHEPAKLGGEGKSRRKRTILTSGPVIEQGHPPAKVTTARRGKAGRGTVVTRARAELKKLEAENREREFEEALHARAFGKNMQEPVLDSENMEEEIEENPSNISAEELRAYAGRNTTDILEIAMKAKTLNKTSVKRLQEAAAGLQEIVDTLVGRTEAEETRRLKIDNGRLRKEVENLKAELKAHRREFSEMRASISAAKASTIEPHKDEDLLEKLKGMVISSVGEIINARFKGIEDRLLPAKVYRPPLATDRKNTAVKPTAPETAPTPEVTANLTATRSGGPKSKKRPLAQTQTHSVLPTTSRPTERQAGVAEGEPDRDLMDEEGFTLVQRKQKKVKKKPHPNVVEGTYAKKAATPAGNRATTSKSKTTLSAPRTAAVVITLQPEAAKNKVSYAEVLEKAEKAVNLSEFCANGLRFRQTITGARMLEFPKELDPVLADKFAAKLRPALEGLAEVTRPVKRVEVRIADLDDSVTSDKVAAAVAKVGNCAIDLVKVNKVQRGPGGMGAVVLQCPVATAKTLIDAGHILVGWSSARVMALKQRPLRCYRCLGIGHTRPMCPSTTDRGSLCFRCGSGDHLAATCEATKLRCAVCDDAGKPSEHVMGSIKCCPPSIRGNAVQRPVNAGGQHAQVIEEAKMTE